MKGHIEELIKKAAEASSAETAREWANAADAAARAAINVHNV